MFENIKKWFGLEEKTPEEILENVPLTEEEKYSFQVSKFIRENQGKPNDKEFEKIKEEYYQLLEELKEIDKVMRSAYFPDIVNSYLRDTRFKYVDVTRRLHRKDMDKINSIKVVNKATFEEWKIIFKDIKSGYNNYMKKYRQAMTLFYDKQLQKLYESGLLTKEDINGYLVYKDKNTQYRLKVDRDLSEIVMFECGKYADHYINQLEIYNLYEEDREGVNKGLKKLIDDTMKKYEE